MNPCAEGSGLCPPSNLRASSFDAGKYAKIPAQSCADPRMEKVWYTCRDNDPPFMGCCASVPCGDGCPDDHLIMALLSTDEIKRMAFLAPMPSVYGEPATGFPTSLSTLLPISEPNAWASSILSVGLLIGVAIGGTTILVALGILIGGNRRRIWKTSPCRLSLEMADSPYGHGSRLIYQKHTSSASPRDREHQDETSSPR